ncbi:hypothetical protein UlMin_007208 [Ulmus minor]
MNSSEGEKKTNRKDLAWKYGTEAPLPPNSKRTYCYITCKFCNKVIKGGVRRLKDHLGGTRRNAAPCPNVPKEVKDEMIVYMKSFNDKKRASQKMFDERVNSTSYFGAPTVATEDVNSCPSYSVSGPQPRGPMDRWLKTSEGSGDVEKGKDLQTMTPISLKEQRNKVCLDIGRFFFENGIAFNVARSPTFINMLRSVRDYGHGFKVSSMHEMRTWILEEEYNTTTKIVDEIKKNWPQTRVSILSDGWTDTRNRSLINFLVNNPYGTVFLKCIDASEYIKDDDLLFKLLNDIVEEVREHLVVQVVTDNASAYKAAGEKLMSKRKQLYWTPCAAHCVDLMLEKIGELPQHKTALLKAKKSNLMRKFTKNEIVRPAVTRFATAYLTLDSLFGMKEDLQRMFVSKKWAGSRWANKAEGKEIKKIIMDDRVFWPSLEYALKTTKPLVHVLRTVDGEKEPAMPYIYGAMDVAKEQIAKNLNNEVGSYKEIWKIIDEKWDNQLHRDLHAAAYFLNPRCKWDDNFSRHPELMCGFYSVMERIIPNSEDFAATEEQMQEYRNKIGFFGMKAAQLSYKTRPPFKILSLTCSASACERNWSTFNQVHTKRRNCLSTKKLNTLVYIMYNKRLKHKYSTAQSRKEDVDPLALEAEDLSSDDEWVANPNDDNEEEEDQLDEEPQACGSKRGRGKRASRKG